MLYNKHQMNDPRGFANHFSKLIIGPIFLQQYTSVSAECKYIYVWN